MKHGMKKYGLLTCACAAALMLSLSACTPSRAVRGNLIEDFQLAEVKPGTDNAQDVLRKLGSPTTKAPFDPNIWYYMGQETEKRGILDPEIVNERVIVVFFDDTGLVKEIKDVDSQRTDIPYVREKTPTSGSEMTVMQQFLGNMGRFNKDAPK